MSPAIPTVASVWQVLGGILDPEFGLSIVDLGLIYRVECAEEKVHVVMTLTTPSCPAGSWIHEGVKRALQQTAPAGAVCVDLVFEPAWNPTMLAAAGRVQLGWNAKASD